jgi:hypothetical protein
VVFGILNFKHNFCLGAAIVLWSFVTGEERGHQGKCLPESAIVVVKPFVIVFCSNTYVTFGINEPL